jgi:two-component system, chemotaxis family, protein-glutamate methylesterase/glutaminase
VAEIPNNLDFVAAANNREIRVMIVDDSVVARSVFGKMLASQKGVKVVCSVANAEKALAYLAKHTVDIILLDIELQGRSGLDALPDLLSTGKNARILVVSSFVERNGVAAIKALSLGACDTLAKPSRVGYFGEFARQLTEKVTRLGHHRQRRSKLPEAPKLANKGDIELRMPGCIAIGASTGGIPGIYKILENLDAKIDCPIFVTQHLPAAFMGFFARQLASVTQRTVKLAEVGTEVLSNTIYLAPGDGHLHVELKGDILVIASAKPDKQSRYCPSVDIMFGSLTAVYGNRMLAIVLSGMGNDGAKSAEALVRNGGQILVQDKSTSVVWGMPGAIARQGFAAAALSPEGIVQKLNETVDTK